MPAAKSRNSLPSASFHAAAAAALGHQRIRACVAGRDQPVVGLNCSPRLWSWQWQINLGPYCACSSCLVIFLSPRRIRLFKLVQLVRLVQVARHRLDARPRTPHLAGRIVQFCSLVGAEKEQAGVFGGPELIAAEEARSSEGGQLAKILPRADAPLARPRPAPGGRCKQSIGGVRLHGIPLV